MACMGNLAENSHWSHGYKLVIFYINSLDHWELMSIMLGSRDINMTKIWVLGTEEYIL